MVLLALLLDVLVLWEPVSAHMDRRGYDAPARVTGRVPRIAVGVPASEDGWRRIWRASGYVERATGAVSEAGQFSILPGRWQVYPHKGQLLTISTSQGKVSRVFQAADQLPVPAWDFPLPSIALLTGTESSRRTSVAVADLPPHLVRAVTAIEDPNFHHHLGLDLASGVLDHLKDLVNPEQSYRSATITRQVARTMFGNHNTSLQQWAQETVVALLLESRYSKDEILEVYLNGLDFGTHAALPILGISEAARIWFGKDLAALDLSEAALLAGAIGASSRAEQGHNVEQMRERRNLVLDRTEALQLADPASVLAARSQPVLFAGSPATRHTAARFIEELVSELDPQLSPETLHRDGLELRSTLDPLLQAAAQDAVAQGIAKLRRQHPQWWSDETGPEAALIVLDPQNGAIRAMAEGDNVGLAGPSLVMHRQGQPGAAFRPIILAAAIADQWPALGPLSEVMDTPISGQASDLRAVGNSDGVFLGAVSLRTATERSRNPPFVRLGLSVGPRRLVETAEALGVRSPLQARLSLALGNQKVTLLDLATAYATLCNGGVRPQPRLLEGVRSRQGNWLHHPMPESQGAVDPRVSSVVTRLLQGVVDRGTAYPVRELEFRLPAAAQPALASSGSDAWMIGYTPDLVVAVWIGGDGPNRLLGASPDIAVPMWTQFMLAAEPYLQGGSFRSAPGANLSGREDLSDSRPTTRQRFKLEEEDRQRRLEEHKAIQRMERDAL